MSYLDSGQDSSPSFLEELVRSLGLGAQPAALPNRAALVSALSGQPAAPPGTHYAQLPGPPLLLPNGGDAVSPPIPAPVSAAISRVAPVQQPQAATNMRGNAADMIPQTGISPASLTPASAAIIVPGYEAKGALTRAQVVAAPDDDKTMPAEEDWDAAAEKLAKVTAPVETPGSAPAPVSLYEQTLKARFEQQEQIAKAATDPEVVRMAISEANKINDELSAIRKPGARVLTDAELTPAERATGAEYQLSPEGVRTQVAGTEGDKTRAPNAEESARIVAAGGNPAFAQVSSGKIDPRALAPPTNAEVELWKAVNADRATRGEPPIALNDFHLEKTVSMQRPGVILGKDGNPIDDNLTGDDVFNAVPGPVARMAKGMLAGTTKIPTLGYRSDQTAKQAFLVAQQASPDLLDVNKVAARREIEAGYARASPGSLGGQVNAGNTAADHLADVVEAAGDLKNVSGGGVPLIAHIANNLRNNIETHQAGRAQELEDGLLHYGQEISKFYAGAQTGEMERLRFLSALGNAKSPEEMAGVFRMEARQLGGKFITLDEQVRNVMGDEGANGYPVVRASTKANANRITVGLSALDPIGPEATGARSPTDIWPGVGSRLKAAGPSAAPGAPTPGFIKGGFRFKGGDPSQQQNWERAQ